MAAAAGMVTNTFDPKDTTDKLLKGNKTAELNAGQVVMLLNYIVRNTVAGAVTKFAESKTTDELKKLELNFNSFMDELFKAYFGAVNTARATGKIEDQIKRTSFVGVIHECFTKLPLDELGVTFSEFQVTKVEALRVFGNVPHQNLKNYRATYNSISWSSVR